MTTIALDENWDVVVDANGCLATVDGCEEIIQCIKQNLRALDLSNFYPIRNNIDAVAAIIQSEISSVEGFIYFNSFEVLQDSLGCGIAQGVTINFSALTTCGNINLGV